MAINSCSILKGEDAGGNEELSDTESKEATEMTSSSQGAMEETPETSKEENLSEADSDRKAVDSEEDEESTTERFEECNSEVDWQTCSEASGDEDEKEECKDFPDNSFCNSSHLLRKDELLEMFKSAHSGSKHKEGQLTVGLVSLHL